MILVREELNVSLYSVTRQVLYTYMKCQTWPTVPLKCMLRRFFFFILTDDLIIQSFQRSHFGPTSFFNLSHSKTTEPQINKWDFISFFKSSRGEKNDNNNSQTFWHFLAKSCSNCCPHTLSVFFFVAGGERLSGVVSAHTQRCLVRCSISTPDEQHSQLLHTAAYLATC